jgi:hypothetical protein
MDIGICMSSEVLAHKLEARDDPNPEQAWNLARWPDGLSAPGQHRLFVASRGLWRGYFLLAPDGLFNPRDPRTPFAILFDTRSWTRIPPAPASRFRGFTYAVPHVPHHAPPTVPAHGTHPAR